MKSVPLCLALLTCSGSTLAENESTSAEPAQSPERDRWVMVSLEGKTPAEAKSNALQAANVQVQPGPDSPPLVATVTPEGRVVTHHGANPTEKKDDPQ